MPRNVSTTCSGCGAPISGTAGQLVRCEYCGIDTVLQAEGVMPVAGENEKYCKYCGSTIHTHAVVCPVCGRQVEQFGKITPTYEPAPLTPEELQRRKANNTATAALIVAIFGLVFTLLCGIFGVTALINGFNAKKLGYVGAKTTFAIVLGICECAFGVLLLALFVYALVTFDWADAITVTYY